MAEDLIPPKAPLLPNPWTGTGPKSTEQPQLLSFLSYFTNRALKCHNGDYYPYELPSKNRQQMPFFQILGHGPPPSDVAGNPGDIYLDLKGPCVQVHVREIARWEPWDWSLMSQSSYRMPPEHPIFLNRYLWVVPKDHSFRLTWVTKQVLTNNRSINIVETITFAYQEIFSPSTKNANLNTIRIKRRRSYSPSLTDNSDSHPTGSKKQKMASCEGDDSEEFASHGWALIVVKL